MRAISAEAEATRGLILPFGNQIACWTDAGYRRSRCSRAVEFSNYAVVSSCGLRPLAARRESAGYVGSTRLLAVRNRATGSTDRGRATGDRWTGLVDLNWRVSLELRTCQVAEVAAPPSNAIPLGLFSPSEKRRLEWRRRRAVFHEGVARVVHHPSVVSAEHWLIWQRTYRSPLFGRRVTC
jgi:hypothetical protein